MSIEISRNKQNRPDDHAKINFEVVSSGMCLKRGSSPSSSARPSAFVKLSGLIDVVKRHVECRRSALPSMWRRSQVLTLTFPLLEGFVFALGVALAVAFCSLRPKLAFRITR